MVTNPPRGHLNVVVVGAGPAGAALSLLLARAGVRVRLIEREIASTRVFRGEGFLPLGLDALREMRLGWSITDIPGLPVRSWRIFIGGEQVFTIPEPVAQLGERAFRVASPSALIDRIIEDARRQSTFMFHPGMRFVAPLRDDDGRVSGIRASGDDGDVEWPADLVVGCDGRGSAVRTRAGLALRQEPEQYDVLWFKVPPPRELSGHCDFLIMVRAGEHPLIAYTSWDGMLQVGLIMPKGTLGSIRDGGDWVAAAVRSAPDWLADHIVARRDQVEGPIRLNVLVGRAPAWSAPGVLLLGDAAHPVSPVRAQGINLALRDVVVAANHLIPLARGADPEVIDAACMAIQAEREPEVARAQKLQRREAQGQGDARAGSWRFTLARHGAKLLGRYAWAQRAWLHRQHDLRFGSVEVRLDPSALGAITTTAYPASHAG
ncbi:MAG TPA: FAD-dependent monooxygenase [Euzebyales bacterium]|nr:FAD-dependent monooxygenase [Euzebyales bacterium]